MKTSVLKALGYTVAFIGMTLLSGVFISGGLGVAFLATCFVFWYFPDNFTFEYTVIIARVFLATGFVIAWFFMFSTECKDFVEKFVKRFQK